MRIFFDENKNIKAVFSDSSESTFVGLFELYAPEFHTKITKTISASRQKSDISGKPLFLNSDGKSTTSATSGFVPNENLTEEYQFSRLVSLQEAPSEWTIEDVLNEKYKSLSQGKNFWFEQFLTLDLVDETSIVNSGAFSISIPLSGVMVLKPIQITRLVSNMTLYTEVDSGVIIELSSDGQNFNRVNNGEIELNSPADTFTFRITNPNTEGVGLAIKAIAIFY